MTAEDQAWVKEQIKAELQKLDDTLRPLIVVNEGAIDRSMTQISGVCANITNHEERISAIES